MAKTQLEQLEMFFKSNINIKNTMSDLAFDPMNMYNEEYLVAYADKLYKGLKYMQDEFLSIASVMFGEYMVDRINKMFSAYYKVLLNSGIDGKRLQNFYRFCISDITPKLAREVKKTCVGYYIFRGIYELLENEVSTNGLLHILHSYIMNNENIYHAVNELSTKENEYKESISLRGDSNNELANGIFENFPLSIDCGKTDIVALKNKTLIMIRDLGHALTIEVEEYQDGIMVRYFIPKLCNIDKINMLPGINKVAPGSEMNAGARGEFLTSKENVLSDLYSFISKVPTDLDIPEVQQYFANQQQKR